MRSLLPVVLCLSLLLRASAAEEPAPNAGGDVLMPYNAAGKWGFLPRDAKRVELTLPPAFDLAYPFRDGRAAVRQNNLWGFIDDKGALAIPCQYDDVQGGIFRGGVAVVKKANQYGVIDRDGKEVLPVKFNSVTLDEKSGRMVATLPNAADPNDFMGLSGLYDLSGKQLLPHEYSYIHAWFKNGVTSVQKGGKYGLANISGELIAPLQYTQMLHSDIKQFIGVKEKGQGSDVYDENGKLLFSAPYDYVGSPNDNRVVFKDAASKLYGYLDASGKVVLEAQFVLAGTFSEGLAIVQRKTGAPVEAIDVDGKSVGSVPGAFIRLDKFIKGNVWLADSKDKKVYLYDRKMQKVFPQGFHYAANFDDNGLSRAQSAPKLTGLINLKGEWVLQPEWSNIEPSSIPKQYIVTKDKEKGIVDAAGQVLFKPQAVSIEKWDEQFVKIAPPGFLVGSPYHCMWRYDGVVYYNDKKPE